MSEIVDRVAQAIREANEDTMGLRYTELTEAMARAAIAAMDEPTEVMLSAAFDHVEGKTLARSIWRDMIKGALK